MKKTNEKGITIISLIITVIVLILLAIVTVNLIIDGSLKEKASGVVDGINNHDKEMAGIKDDVRNIIKPGEFEEKNTPPTIIANVKDVTASTATIVAEGSDEDGDILYYTLTINGKSSEESTAPDGGNTISWTIEKLKAHTEYEYTVAVTDKKAEEPTTTTGKFTTGNTEPTLSVSVSNIKSTSATITANGSDADGDTLQYTLKINGKTYGPSTTRSWNVTDLTVNKTYSYTVEVTDGKVTITKTGNFTTTNTAPTLTVSASNIKSTSATITATGYDADGDSLTYKLVINNQTYTSSTGKFDVTGLKAHTTYSYTATVSDGKESVSKTYSLTTANTQPTLSVSVSETTEYSVKITATGSDADGDTLQYTLTINEKTYGPSTTNEWTISDLSSSTSYYYTVTVTDGNGGTTNVSGYANTEASQCANCGGTRTGRIFLFL